MEDPLAPFSLKLNAQARKSGLQLTEAGLLRTQQIACVRIHVECAINHAERIRMHVDVIIWLPA